MTASPGITAQERDRERQRERGLKRKEKQNQQIRIDNKMKMKNQYRTMNKTYVVLQIFVTCSITVCGTGYYLRTFEFVHESTPCKIIK